MFSVWIHCEMITTVKLVNIFITSFAYHFFACGENTYDLPS